MKILLVKLGAMGDVLRTTPLLPALQRRYPGAEIHWIVADACREALEGNAAIHHLWIYKDRVPEDLKRLFFDLAINLDKDPEALDSLDAARAAKKMGFGRDAKGQLAALDSLSDYAYRLGIDDELKFRINQKSYQQISFEQAGLNFDREEYQFELGSDDLKFAQNWTQKLGIILGDAQKPLIGLNTGAGTRFAGKKLPAETWIELADKLAADGQTQVLLLGGEAERARNEEIQSRARHKIFNAGNHSLKRFAAIVRLCKSVVTGDTTAMHIAIAVKTLVVCYFGSTCAQEIELYGRGRKMVATVKCAPCYKKTCPYNEECMTEFTADSFYEALEEAVYR